MYKTKTYTHSYAQVYAYAVVCVRASETITFMLPLWRRYLLQKSLADDLSVLVPAADAFTAHYIIIILYIIMYYVRVSIYIYIYNVYIGSAARLGFGGRDGRLFFNILSASLQIIISIGTSFWFLRTISFSNANVSYLYLLLS